MLLRPPATQPPDSPRLCSRRSVGSIPMAERSADANRNLGIRAADHRKEFPVGSSP